MKIRRSSIVTAIVTAIVTTTSFVTPASAEILTVCSTETSVGGVLPSHRLAGPIIRLSGRADGDDGALIALSQDDKGFDILINWGESAERSLRAEGAEIIGASPDPEFIHLMVAQADGELEHFLFSLDAAGAGQLVRSRAAEVPGAPDSTTDAVCTKPR